MANKREFKKYVDALGVSLIDEMVSTFYNVPGADKDKIAKAIEKVLGGVAKAKNNANVFFDRGHKSFASHEEYAKAKTEFFNTLFEKINKEFADDVNEALKLFNSAIPEAEKARNKQIAVEVQK